MTPFTSSATREPLSSSDVRWVRRGRLWDSGRVLWSAEPSERVLNLFDDFQVTAGETPAGRQSAVVAPLSLPQALVADEPLRRVRFDYHGASMSVIEVDAEHLGVPPRSGLSAFFVLDEAGLPVWAMAFPWDISDADLVHMLTTRSLPSLETEGRLPALSTEPRFRWCFSLGAEIQPAVQTSRGRITSIDFYVAFEPSIRPTVAPNGSKRPPAAVWKMLEQLDVRFDVSTAQFQLLPSALAPDFKWSVLPSEGLDLVVGEYEDSLTVTQSEAAQFLRENRDRVHEVHVRGWTTILDDAHLSFDCEERLP